MSYLQLITKALGHYWRTNLAVIAGVAVGAAVIIGALIVGDSVRDSMKQMTLDRLGGVDYSLPGSRFFREQLAKDLSTAASQDEKAPAVEVAPAILLTCSLQFDDPDKQKNTDEDSPEASITIAGRVNMIAADERLWQMLGGEDETRPDDEGIVLNNRVAEQLKVEVGDEVTMFVDVPQTIPQESLLGERDVDELVIEYPLTVRKIVDAKSTLGRFSLQASQQLPLNAYVELDRLQLELDLAEVPESPRNPIAKPARVNTLLFQDNSAETASLASAPTRAGPLNRLLAEELQLDDFYL